MNATLLLVIGIALFVVLLIWVMGMYNGLVRKRVRVEASWAQTDVQLKRRHDLIPNLVETVKGYASHERETLDAVISARARAVSAEGPAAQGQAEGLLTAALGKLFALAEAYPDLKANTNFLELQTELSATESKIAGARSTYNEDVRHYETARQTFPSALVAAAFNFAEKEYFEVTDEAVRAAPKVSFN